MEASDAKNLGEHDRENNELKKMVANHSLDARMLNELNSKE